jgi:hypothetical protein
MELTKTLKQANARFRGTIVPASHKVRLQVRTANVRRAVRLPNQLSYYFVGLIRRQVVVRQLQKVVVPRYTVCTLE